MDEVCGILASPATRPCGLYVAAAVKLRWDSTLHERLVPVKQILDRAGDFVSRRGVEPRTTLYPCRRLRRPVTASCVRPQATGKCRGGDPIQRSVRLANPAARRAFRISSER